MMSDLPPLRINNTEVSEKIRRDMHALVDAAIASILENVAYYRELPAEVVTVDVREVIYENLRVVRKVFDDRAQPGPANLAAIEASAFRRAEEGIPLEMVVGAYLVAAHETWRLITADARPDDIEDFRTVTDLVMDYQQAVLATVTSAYLEELRMSYTQEQSLQTSLVSALLEGDQVQEHAAMAGYELPPAFLVLALSVDQHAGEADGGVGASITARRKVRQIRTVIGSFADRSTLMMLDSSGGSVLIPTSAPLTSHLPGLRSLVTALADAADAQVSAAVAYAAPAGVFEAARQTKELIEVVKITGRAPGLYQLEDVLLDYQLTRTTPATAALAALLDPLNGHVDLLQTLKSHLSNELNRKETAAMLNVHPNTVDYRLRRIAILTGLDVSVPSHLPLLEAAIAASRTRPS
jgi:sugar diacid utilization regulator